LPEDSIEAPWEVRRRLSYKNRTEEELTIFNKERVTEKWIQSSKAQAVRLNNEYWKTDEGKKRREELSKTQLKNALKIRMDNEDSGWINRFDASQTYYTLQEVLKIYGGGKVAVKRRLKAIGYVFKPRPYTKRHNKIKIRTEEEKQRITEKNDQKWLSKFDTTKEYMSVHEIRRTYGGSRIDILRRLDKIGFTNVKTFIRHKPDIKSPTYNHKVVSIKKIILDEEIPVYDIEVPLTSNFGLSAGIFVHNSKDLSDAAGQIIYHMHINPMYNDTPLMPIAIHDGSSVSSRETMEDTLENFNKWVQKG
jgi:hypothetical protein